MNEQLHMNACSCVYSMKEIMEVEEAAKSTE